MKPEIKKLWLEALRSRKYKQGKGLLRSGEEFCCLGVLCDLHSKQTSLGAGWRLAPTSKYARLDRAQPVSYLQSFKTLPEVVVEWAGLDDSNPAARINKRAYVETVTLASYNDRGASFEAIAEVIESSL